MTGYILKPFFDRVEILSDGANYLPDGTVVDIREKVKTSPILPLAVVGSGSVPVIDVLSDMIFVAAKVTESVDDTLAILAESLSAIRAKGFAGDSPARMAIGAISETRGPLTLFFSTFEDEAAAPFELHDRPFGFGQGEYPPPEEMVAAGWSHSAPLAEYGPFLFEYMRARKRQNPAYPDAELIYSIGGHLDLTVVRSDGYERRLLLTWPDVVGERIDPNPPEDTGVPFDDGSMFSDGTGWA
ncbi:hypothetical protein [Rhizobium brockwellii]|uniref:hypothetical protein n=1 Tax=Rhizobium brockwellii TaxID=3019932 RepID=UPI000522F576|nr:hypothetical protein [Rhizobium brockwellii]KPN22644.1 hypothetical protein KS05_32310 [Rhizobium brockwellii]QJX04737.1 hypothetical protein RLCC275e_07150 [Rhizobium brockwellii]